ncbi:MAG: aldo/keto reductase [Rhizobiales bacterium]|nr:aldo/keto reductase [Hyphomicrobiales bacterium]MBO6700053.1 aldo/keto reductase [Hyphomicrobiales bacterium]MBO6737782.1 aldo/keto reductase [Hyphomicrobiales bacterium]MBO6913161.1 aldo/keto reductase [Hyphomicrobiales bacterium]MBO6954205.1 aldo/keto reductase [Hyphomicrobiales bacterium]
MEKRPLGRTGMDVSVICLGTMTWGQQNTEADGHEQMDYALDQGINFFDTAELYAIPPKAETQGSTERIIGSWFANRKNRDKVILASKVVGATTNKWFRGQEEGVALPSKKNVFEAVDASLKRLQTDYIDLYQLHWPGRPFSIFGTNPIVWEPTDGPEVAVAETLDAFDELVKSGKVRAIGLSNESSWGAMRWITESEKSGKERIASIQNAYNIVNRTYEVNLAEVGTREEVSLLAYSPLGQGYLTGKYRNGAQPAGARGTLFGRLGRYQTPGAEAALEAYFDLCDARGLDYSQTAIRFTTSKPFVASSIIGATSMDQLKHDIAAWEMPWDDDLDKAINELHMQRPNVCP